MGDRATREACKAPISVVRVDRLVLPRGPLKVFGLRLRDHRTRVSFDGRALAFFNISVLIVYAHSFGNILMPYDTNILVHHFNDSLFFLVNSKFWDVKWLPLRRFLLRIIPFQWFCLLRLRLHILFLCRLLGGGRLAFGLLFGFWVHQGLLLFIWRRFDRRGAFRPLSLCLWLLFRN